MLRFEHKMRERKQAEAGDLVPRASQPTLQPATIIARFLSYSPCVASQIDIAVT